ncbi:MAG: TasA family protein [Anaeromassilibacillus sp.]
MKTKKSRVVLSSVSVLLVLSLLAGMTMAWFTDTEKVNANFTAGVLDISVKPGETDKGDLTFENLRPMLYDNFYKELEPNGNEKWVNDVTQDNTTGLDDEDYAPVPAYFKPVVIKNEGTLPAKVKLSLEAGDGCEAGEPILTEDNITIKQDPEKMQDCANRLAPVLKVFVYKLVDGTWTKVEDVNLNTAYDEAKANPDKVASDNTAKETNNTYMTAMLPAQGTATYVIAGYLPETVNNAYQGQHFHGKLVLNAYQMDDTGAGNPDQGGSSSTDPEDPDRFNENVTIEWREGTAEGDLVKSQNETVKSDTTIAAVNYDAPEGYVYSPEAAEQSTEVTVNDETGEATPGKVIFTVVPEEAKAIEYVLYYRNTVDGQLLTQTETVSLEYPGEYTIVAPNAPASRTRATEKDRISAPIPAGYMFDPDTQAYDVAVNAEGTATPTRITFDVKPESTEPTDPDPEEHPEAYQVRVDFRNQETGVLLDQSYSKTYSGLTKGVHTFTPVGEAQNDTEVLHYVTAPEGYEYDPAGQSAKFVTIPAAKGPQVIEFTVQYVGGGSTDPEEPDNPNCDRDDHIIRDAEDLYNVRLHPHCNFIFANDVDLSEAYPNWEPIGVLEQKYDPWNGTYYEPSENVFTGDMNGNGHVLTGLNVGTLKSYNGLFTYSAGTIRNLTVNDAKINAHSNSGILVGWNAGKIQNCTVSGNVTAGDSFANIWEVGGITGWNDTTGVISGCASLANVSGNPANLPVNTPVHYYYGGVAGSNSGTVTNCYSTGTVKGARAGGLLGLNQGTISNCYTTSRVYALTDSFGNVDTSTHPVIGWMEGGTVGKETIFFRKGNLYRGGRLYTGWDTDKARGQGKTEEEMKTASTYTDAGWDTGVWNIVDGTYPTLQ